MVQEMLSERGKRALVRVFEDAKYRLIGQATTDPSARPFPNLSTALINAVKTTTKNQIITILANEGYAITTALRNSVTDFANNNVNHLVDDAKATRMGALSSDDKRAADAKRAYQFGDSAAPPGGYTGPHAPQ
jgi:replication-associated recombination protein RarA